MDDMQALANQPPAIQTSPNRGTITELIYLPFKPTVKPEDAHNAEGQEFVKKVETTKNQIGYVGSSWGRSLEDNNLVVWAIGKSRMAIE